MTTANGDLLVVDSVSAAYGKVQALRNVSVSVGATEIVSLIGANGAGKTTTLCAISGLLPIRSGRLVFDGLDITATPAHERVAMGIAHVPEGRRIFATLSVEENLLMGAYTRRASGPVHLDQVLEMFPILAERRRQAGGTLSGGEQQMLAIGRALMSRPRLLLLDEPSMGLAPRLVQQIFRVIADIPKTGTAVFLVEQNARRALRIASRGYVLQGGQIAMTDTTDRLRDDPAVQAAYLGGARSRSA